MAFLESRLKQIDEIISAPSKEGGISVLDGKKIGNFYGYQIYTVPLFHHSFKYWKQYLAMNTINIVDTTIKRCYLQCQNDVKQISGNSISGNEINFKKCAQDCNSTWGGSFIVSMRLAEKEANKVFYKCLSGKIKNELEYENVLDCKSVGFQDYMDRVLDYEEKYLNEALNKYS